MERVGEHPVPAGPLAVRWLGYEIEEQRAGVATPRARAARERRLGAMALARTRGRAARVPLARPARERDRLGWDARRPFRMSYGPERRSSSRRRCSLRGHRGATGSRSTSSRSSASGSRSSDRRRSTSPWRSGRASTSGGSESAFTASPIPSWKLRSQPRTSRSSPTTPSPSLTSFPARSPRPTGRASCSTRTRRATAAVGGAIDAESRGDRRRLAAWAPGGGRNPRLGEPLLLPSLLDGMEPETHEGLPSYSGNDGLFEGRAVVRLRSRSGRPSG